MKLRVILLIVASLFNLIFWFGEYHVINDIAMIFPLISIVLSVLYILPKKIKGQFEIKIFYILIAGILFYNSPLYFKALFNSKEALNVLLYYRIKQSFFVKANLLLGVSLPLITAGYLIEVEKAKTIQNQFKNNLYKLRTENLGIYSIFALIFLVLSISKTGLTIGSTYIGSSSGYYMPLIRMIYLIGTIIFFNRMLLNKFKIKFKNLQKDEVFAFVIILMFIIYVLIGGDRGPAFNTMLILVFGLLLMQRMTIKKRYIIIGLIGIVIFYNLFKFIEILRLVEDDDLNKEVVQSVFYSFKDYKDSNNVSGTNIRTTSVAIEGIENNLYPHTYGLFFLQAVVRGIPYIGNKIVELFVSENSIFYAGSARLITIQISGFDYTSGLGTSYLADTYIEFGLIGVVLISFLFGILTGMFENKIKTLSFKSFSDFLIVVIFVSTSFYVGRGILGGFVVNFIHTWFYYIIIKILIKPFKINYH